MPVLPDVAIRLAEMLRQADLPVNAYVSMLNKDSALSVEVLKAANAACYGAATTTSLEQAVVRIGLSRLQSVLMLAHLRARVLKGSSLFRRTGELLLEISLPLGFMASKLARVQGAADVRFVRGMLMHVEHMVVLGALSDISRERRIGILPTAGALHQAFVRFGPDIRETVSASWNLADVLLGERAMGMQAEYAGLRDALICRWLGRPLPTLLDVDADRLEQVMVQINPRVRQPESATA
jgi:HD-like signal output (HDOD) protein